MPVKFPAAQAMAKRRWRKNGKIPNPSGSNGRPRTVPHDSGAKRCRCAKCRRARHESPYKAA